MALVVGSVVAVALWLGRPGPVVTNRAPPRTQKGDNAARDIPARPSCVRVLTSMGEGLSGLRVQSDADGLERWTDADGQACLPPDALPANVSVVGWPTLPASVLVAPGDAVTLLIAPARCALALDVERDPAVPADRPKRVLLRRPGWEETMPAVGTSTVPCGELDVRLADDLDLWVSPAVIPSDRATLHIGVRPTLAVRVLDDQHTPLPGALVNGTPTDAEGRAQVQAWAPYCAEIVAAGFVTGSVCPTADGWPTGEQEVALSRSRRVRVACDIDGVPGACARPHTAVCGSGALESTCSPDAPFVCDCPTTANVRIEGGGRLSGWAASVEGDTATLTPGTATVVVVGDEVVSLGADACGATFLLDTVGERGSRLAPRKASCRDGRVGWFGLAPGRWLLTASEGPLATVGPFDLGAGEHREIRLEEPSGAPRRVVVHVRLADGTPAANAQVRVRYAGAIAEGTLSDRAGGAAIDVYDSALEILGADADGRACREPVAAGDVTCVLDWTTVWSDWER